jgi:hypothetical protein
MGYTTREDFCEISEIPELKNLKCKSIIEIIEINSQSKYKTQEDANRYVGCIILASDAKVGPEFIKDFIYEIDGNLYYFIVTKRYEHTLESYLNALNTKRKNNDENCNDFKEQIFSLKIALLELMDVCIKKFFYCGELCNDYNNMILLDVDENTGTVLNARLQKVMCHSLTISSSTIQEEWCCLWEKLRKNRDNVCFREHSISGGNVERLCGYKMV